MLSDFAISTTLGQEESPDSRHGLCINEFYPLLDCFQAKLDYRFSENNKQLLKSITAMDLRSSKYFSTEIIDPMAFQYEVELSDLVCQSRGLI